MKDHIRLDTDCILGHQTKRPIVSIKSDTKCGWTSVAKARLVLCEYLGINRAELTTDIHTCHACNDERCVNPLHLYFGSAFDNMQDVPTEIKQQAARRWDRGVRFIAIEPSGTRYVADSFKRLQQLIPLSSSSFYKYAAHESPITPVKGQRVNKWQGWRFMTRSCP